MKQIIQQLREIAKMLPDAADVRADKIEVSFEGFKVRCLPTKPAALALAAKLERNKNTGTFKQPRPLSTARRFNNSALNEMIAAGEYDNAAQYAALYNRTIYYCLCKEAPAAPIRDAKPYPHDHRFVTGRSPAGEWRTYLIKSGQYVGMPATNRSGAILAAQTELEANADKLESIIENAKVLKNDH